MGDAAEERQKEYAEEEKKLSGGALAKMKRDAKRQHMLIDADRKKDPTHKNPMSLQNMYSNYGAKSKSSIALELRNAAREKLLDAEDAKVEAILSKWQNEPIQDAAEEAESSASTIL